MSDAIYFDGVNDYTYSTDLSSIISDTSGSVELWFKTNSTSLTPFFSVSDTSTNNLCLYIASTSQGAITVYHEGDEITTHKSGWNDSRWHHLVVSSTGTAWEIWVDSKRYGVTGTNTGDWFAELTSPTQMTFGALIQPNPVYGNFYLDELSIYSSQLTQSDINSHYVTSGVLSEYAQLVVSDGAVNYWRFNDSEEVVYDLVGNANLSWVGRYTLEQPGALVDNDTSVLLEQKSEYDDSKHLVSLLLPGFDKLDYSTVKKTVTSYGNTTNSIAQFKYYGRSLYFDGSGDALTAPSTTMAFGVDDFTIEMWLNISTPAVSSYPFILTSSAYNSGSGFYMPVQGTGTGWGGIGSISFNGASTLAFSPGVESVSVIRGAGWKHIAVTRVGVITRLFVDGILEDTHTAAGVANYGASWAGIMSSTGSSTGGDKGYLQDLRITKGLARYTKNFTPPPRLFDYETSLYIHSDNQHGLGSFTDKSDYAHVITAAGNVQHSTTVVKDGFGSSSIYFDGSGDYLNCAYSSEFDLSVSDFTIEVYAYFLGTTTTTGIYPAILGKRNAGTDWDYTIWVAGGTTVYFMFGDEALGNKSIPLSSFDSVLNRWVHFAMVRHGSTMMGFIDGVLRGSIAISGNVRNRTLPVTVGNATNTDSSWRGYIQDLRVTKGVAKYTENFTPPQRYIEDYTYAYALLPDYRTSDNAGTIEAWVKYNRNSKWSTIVSSSDIDTSNERFSFRINHDGLIEIFVTHAGTQYRVHGVRSLEDNLWHHVAVTSDGASYKLYVDGFSETLTVAEGTNSGLWFNDVTSRESLIIGSELHNNNSFGSLNYTGQIDDVAIYDKALTNDDILEHYLTGKGEYSSDYYREIMGDSPVNYWRMSEDTGYLIDQMNEHHLTCVNSPTYKVQGAIDGDTDTAVSFNGTNQYASKEVTDYRGGDSRGSVECWLNLSTLGSQRCIFTINGTSSPNDVFNIVLTETDLVGVYHRYNTSNEDWVVMDSPLTVGVYHHIVITSDSSTYKIYVDGVERSVTILSGSNSGDWLTDLGTTNNVMIGAYNTTVVGQYFSGSIDEVAVYDYPLTYEQVKSHYKTGAPERLLSAYEKEILSDSPVNYWRMNENTGLLYDSVGELDLTWVGTPELSDGSIWNDVDHSVTLDGATEYANKAVANYRSADSQGSIEVWCKDISSLGYAVSSADTASTSRYISLILDPTTVYFTQRNNDTYDSVSNSTVQLDDGSWHHVVVTSDSNSYKIYVDGGALALTATNGTNSGDWFADTTERDNITIGDLIRTSSTGKVAGSLDEVAVYDYPLAPEQIVSHYKTGIKPRKYTGYALEVMTSNPLAYYRLDDATGTIAQDEQYGNPGTYVNSPTLNTDGLLYKDINNAVELSRINSQYIEVPRNTVFDSLFYLMGSIEFWMNYNDSVIGSGVNSCRLIDYDSAGSAVSGWSINFDGLTKNIGFYIRTDNGNSEWVFDTPIEHDITYHIVFKYDSSDVANDPKLYVNGVLSDVTLVQRTADIVIPTETTSQLRFGNNRDVSRFYDGILDEIAIYDKELSDSEIVAHYDAGKTPEEYTGYALEVMNDSPLAYWRLGETAGSIVYDEVNLNHGSIVNSLIPVGGLLTNDNNGAMEFDGASNYIALGSDVVFCDMTSEWSVECVINVQTRANWGGIVQLRTNTSEPFELIISEVDSPAYLDIYFGLAGNDRRVLLNTSLLGYTYHIVVTYNNTNNTWKFYVNGVEQTILSTDVASSKTNNSYIGIFEMNSGSTKYYYDGIIDEVSVYSYELTSDQVLSHYQKAVDYVNWTEYTQFIDAEPNKWAWYKFDGDTRDSSGNSRHLTTYGTCTYENDLLYPENTSVKSLKMVTNGYADLAGSFYSTSMSIECWVTVHAYPASSNCIVVGFSNTGGGQAYGISLNSSGNSYIHLYGVDSAIHQTQSKYLKLNERYHLVLSQSTDGIRFYVNGEYVGFNSYAGGFNPSTYNRFYVNQDIGGNSDFADYTIDQLVIYNGTTLTPEQVRQRYELIMPAMPASEYRERILSLSPVGYYPCDDAGGNILDISGNLNHMTATNVAYDYTNTPMGPSLYLNGTNASIKANDIINGRSLYSFTIEAWIKNYNVGTDTYPRFIVVGESAITNEFILSMDTTSRFYFVNYNNPTTTVIGMYYHLLEVDWHHMVIQYDGPLNKVRFYIDGILYGEGSLPANSISGLVDVVFGSALGQNVRFNEIEIQHIAIYDSFLSESDIKQNYALGSGYVVETPLNTYEQAVIADNPIVYYPLDEESGTVIHDRMNNMDGVLMGGDASALTSEGFIAGQNALEFNGSTEYVNFLDNVAHRTTNKLTVECMVEVNTLNIYQQLACTYGPIGQLNGWILRVENNNKFVVYIPMNSTTWCVAKTNTSPKIGKQYHVAATYDGTDIFIYINGQLDSTITSGTVPASLFYDEYTEFNLGSLYNSTSERLNGKLAHAAVYYEALTKEQINEHVSAWKGRASSDYITLLLDTQPERLYLFDEDDGITCDDYLYRDSGPYGTGTSNVLTPLNKDSVKSLSVNGAENSGIDFGDIWNTTWAVANTEVVIEAWFTANDIVGEHVLVKNGGSSNGFQIGFYNNLFGVWVRGDNTLASVTTSNINVLKYFRNHVIVKIDLDTLSLYLNGELIGTTAKSALVWWLGNSGASIGRHSNAIIASTASGTVPTSTHSWTGNIDTVVLYKNKNDLFTPEKVLEHYNTGLIERTMYETNLIQLDKKPYFWMNFNDTWTDRVGNLTATVTQPVSWSLESIQDKSAYFSNSAPADNSASSTLAITPDSFSSKLLNTTLSVWIKPLVKTNFTHSNAYYYFIGNYYNSTYNNHIRRYLQYDATQQKFRFINDFYSENNAWTSVSSDHILNPGEWSHIVWHQQISNSSPYPTYCNIWINGSKITLPNDGIVNRGNVIYTHNTDYFYIGSHNTSYNHFYGYMDEYMLFDGELTDSEVLQLYYAGKPSDYHISGTVSELGIITSGVKLVCVKADNLNDVKYTVTDENGAYIFDRLDDADYHIMALSDDGNLVTKAIGPVRAKV